MVTPNWRRTWKFLAKTVHTIPPFSGGPSMYMCTCTHTEQREEETGEFLIYTAATFSEALLAQAPECRRNFADD